MILKLNWWLFERTWWLIIVIMIITFLVLHAVVKNKSSFGAFFHDIPNELRLFRCIAHRAFFPSFFHNLDLSFLSNDIEKLLRWIQIFIGGCQIGIFSHLLLLLRYGSIVHMKTLIHFVQLMHICQLSCTWFCLWRLFLWYFHFLNAHQILVQICVIVRFFSFKYFNSLIYQ